MKRIVNILSLFLTLCLLFSAASCAEAKVVPFSDLPTEAQTFIKTHFAGAKVLQVTKEFNEYNVIFADRSKLEFDRSGNWKEIDCKGSAVPEGAIPARIQSYIKANFPSDKVRSIDRNVRGYEVKITSGFELEFDKNCNFIRIDD